MRLGALATLLGREAAPFSRCRVLEIGGGDGSNLIAMAMGAPASEFLSFDLAESAAKRGQQIVASLGLTNVQVAQIDLTQVPDSVGQFDYVIAHGVYAWVPAPVRHALMQLVGRVLSPRGMAFISYNAMPAGHTRRALRDLLLQHVGSISNPVERVKQARAVLAQYIERWVPDKAGPSALREQAVSMLKKQDAVIYHDELGECFEPQLIADVVAAAKGQGLDYLCDAQLSLAQEGIAPGEAYAAAKTLADSFAAFEQVKDLTDARGFRESVFVRAGEPLQRQAKAERVAKLWINGKLTQTLEQEAGKTVYVFKGTGSIVARTDHEPLAKLLTTMSAHYPASLPLAGQVGDDDLALLLIQLAASGAIDLTTEQMPFVTTIPAKPKISALARYLIAKGESEVPTLRHNPVKFTDQTTTGFIALMDGSREVIDIARAMSASTKVPLSQAREQVTGGIKAMMEMGLLVAS